MHPNIVHRLARTKTSRALLVLFGLVTAAATALAHPHVWVTYEMTVDYKGNAVSGVEHIWTFDDGYTQMALEGLDKNNDGVYDETELAELLKVNLEGLKEFNYFTTGKLGEQELAFGPPEKGRLVYKDKILSLHFRLPLIKPIPADAKGLSFAVYDPSNFIAFEPEQTDALKLASAPAGCVATFVDPNAEQTDEQTKRLGEAMAQQLGGDAASAYAGAYRSVAVSCKKL